MNPSVQGPVNLPDWSFHSSNWKRKIVSRKYHSDSLKIEFYLAGDLFVHGLQCFLCYETLSNSGMKLWMLLSHFQAKYSSLSSKPVELSQIKFKIVFSRVKLINSVPEGPEQNKASKASFKVTFLIAKADLLRSLQHQPQSWWQTYLKGKKFLAESFIKCCCCLSSNVSGMQYEEQLFVWMTVSLYSLLKSLVRRVCISL